MRLSATCLIWIALCSSSCSSLRVSRTAAAPPTPGDYFMTTRGLCADLGAEHASDTHENIHRGPCNGTVFQRWTIRADPNRTDRFLIEWFSNSGKFWSAENFSESADHVTFDPRRDSAFQAWKFESQSDGSYHIINDGNAKCVNFNAVGGADILLTSCSSTTGVSITLQTVQ
jgi:hypothetical protein